MILTNEDKQKIKDKSHEFTNISTGKYFVKRYILGDATYQKRYNIIPPMKYATSELIGHKICEILKIYSPNYQIVDINDGWIYVLSDDINNVGEFRTAEDIGINFDMSYSLYDIWNQLEKEYKQNPHLYGQIPFVFNDIIKMYIMDILFCNRDRYSFNWGIVNNHGHIFLAAFDNECMFNNYTYPIMTPAYDGNIENNMINSRNKDANVEANLRKFYQDSSQEYLDVFSYYLNLFSPNYFVQILSEIDKEEVILTSNGNKPLNIDQDYYLKKYQDNYNKILNIWKELKHGRK